MSGLKVGLFSDEGGRMLNGYAMSKDNLIKTACGLSGLWDGKPISRVRGGDGNLNLFGRRFSTHLMIQETILGNLLKNEDLIGQGLLARFLIVCPSSNMGNRPYQSVNIAEDEAIKKFWGKCSFILDQKFPLADENIENELAPRRLELSPEAKSAWITFHDELDRQCGPDGFYQPVQRTACKAAEQVLRIAGVLTLFDHLEATHVSLEAVERAILLVKFYLDEALRLFEAGYFDPNLELAQKVLNWMEKKATEPSKTFTLIELYQRAGPRGIRTKKDAEKIIRILEEHKKVERLAQSEWRLMR